MIFEGFESFVASLGSATVIIGAGVHFWGKVWAKNIAAQTVSKFNIELETTKAANKFALDEFKIRSEGSLKEREQYNGISFEVYQEFIKNRVKTYIELLNIVNSYTTNTYEDISVEESESWGDVYNSTYVSLKKVITTNQLYISNELETIFDQFRLKAADYVKEADLEEVRATINGAHPVEAEEQKCHVYARFSTETDKEMKDVIQTIKSDVSKLRSRIEIDKAE